MSCKSDFDMAERVPSDETEKPEGQVACLPNWLGSASNISIRIGMGFVRPEHRLRGAEICGADIDRAEIGNTERVLGREHRDVAPVILIGMKKEQVLRDNH